MDVILNVGVATPTYVFFEVIRDKEIWEISSLQIHHSEE